MAEACSRRDGLPHDGSRRLHRRRSGGKHPVWLLSFSRSLPHLNSPHSAPPPHYHPLHNYEAAVARLEVVAVVADILRSQRQCEASPCFSYAVKPLRCLEEGASFGGRDPRWVRSWSLRQTTPPTGSLLIPHR